MRREKTRILSVTMSGFDAKAIGPQTVTLTYSDAYGNQTTDSTTVRGFATITGQATTNCRSTRLGIT
uniref:hypothetical protein n=1 Tax=Lactiplantibacillus plantarum TaxID=1590 RepID=UPI00215D7157|nr:hypothetical protein [Lactiplantibacillus plantarum]